MAQPLVSSPRLPDDDLVLRWRAWKNGKAGIGPWSDPPFAAAPGKGAFRVPEGDLVWMMLEIERLRAAIEGLVKTDGGRQ